MNSKRSALCEIVVLKDGGNWEMCSWTAGKKNVEKRELQGFPVAESWHARPEPGPDPCSHDALPNRENIKRWLTINLRQTVRHFYFGT